MAGSLTSSFLFSGDVEFLLNLPKYHVSTICTHETEVLWIHKAHFDRLFRRKNPSSLKVLAHLIQSQVASRLTKESLQRRLPFFHCLQLKLADCKEMKKKDKQEEAENLPQVNMDNMLIRQRSYSHMEHRLPKPSSRSAHRHRNHSSMDMFPLRPVPLPNPNLTAQGLPDLAAQGVAQVDAAGNDVIVVKRPLLNPREGIFVKLMQINNPDTTADQLLIDDEEFRYLSQLRRRIAKEFQDFSMAKKAPFSEGLEGTIERPCRKGCKATTKALAKRMFPMLLSKPRGAGSMERRGVRIS